MSVSAAIPQLLPSAPPAVRGTPPAEPTRPEAPFAGLLGEKRLALARAGQRETPARPAADAPADAPTPAQGAEANATDAVDDEAIHTKDEDAGTEPSPLLDWFACWQADPAAARGLPHAEAATTAPEGSDAVAVDAAAPSEPRDPALASAADSRGRSTLPTAARGKSREEADAGAQAAAASTTDRIQAEHGEREAPPAHDAAPARVEFALPEHRNVEAPVTPHAAAIAAHAPAGAAAAGSVPVLTLATPLHAPDFSQALAAQLTTLARDGVHEARLQLNPAEMGPIAVQIVVDGSQAQIDFAAAQAGTRQALEASLPSLAAGLQSLGLTLSGGGVFEHGGAGRDAPREATPSRGPRRAGADGGEAIAGTRTVALPARAGLLDLYA